MVECRIYQGYIYYRLKANWVSFIGVTKTCQCLLLYNLSTCIWSQYLTFAYHQACGPEALGEHIGQTTQPHLSGDSLAVFVNPKCLLADHKPSNKVTLIFLKLEINQQWVKATDLIYSKL